LTFLADGGGTGSGPGPSSRSGRRRCCRTGWS